MRFRTRTVYLIQREAVQFIKFWFIAFALCCQICESEKIRYATDNDCDRYSLDAVYHDKYKPITHNIFADSKEFVSRVCDLLEESLTTIMAELPDRDVSDNHEKKVHVQFKSIRSMFASKIKKIQKNITSSWEELVSHHFDLMFDNGKSSLADYENKTIRMTDSYAVARKTFDTTLSSFVDFIKGTIRDGLTGIEASAKEALKKEEEEKKKNETQHKEEGKSKDDVLLEKMIEIANMVVPGFLKKVSIEVINKKMDLKKATGVNPEMRDTPLDDVDFDMKMVKNRIRAIIQLDTPKDKGATDLARRSIYTYWVDHAEEMYKEKIQSRQVKTQDNSSTGRLYYRNLWKDEEQLVETLLNLMEIYP